MPKKNEILYVKGMNLSESDGEDSNEDIWDDRKLNDAYDKALRIANAEVAKRVAMSTNTSQKKKEDQSIKKEKLSNKGKSPKNSKKNQNQTEWKAGMPCRAVYEEDGVEYEAFVLRIINDNECVVRFLGYENSEIVSISTLKPTLGTEERTRQIEEALDDKTDEVYTSQVPNIEKMECGSERAPSLQSTDSTCGIICRSNKSAVCEHAIGKLNHYIRFDKPQVLAMENRYVPRKPREAIEIKKHPNFNGEDGWNLPPPWDPVLKLRGAAQYSKTSRYEKSHVGRKKTAKKKKYPSTRQSNSFDLPAMPFEMPNISALRSLGAMDMPLPPPPPLPLGDRGRCDSEEQAISSMLLSWYMSGYYTGLYQGMKRAKESRRNV